MGWVTLAVSSPGPRLQGSQRQAFGAKFAEVFVRREEMCSCVGIGIVTVAQCHLLQWAVREEWPFLEGPSARTSYVNVSNSCSTWPSFQRARACQRSDRKHRSWNFNQVCCRRCLGFPGRSPRGKDSSASRVLLGSGR